VLVAISISAHIGFEFRQLQIRWLCGDLQIFMEPVYKTSDQQIPILTFCKQVIAIVTPNRLPSVWKKYRDGILSHQDAMRILLESDDELDEHFQAEQNKPP
jgi:hypothetical protein